MSKGKAEGCVLVRARRGKCGPGLALFARGWRQVVLCWFFPLTPYLLIKYYQEKKKIIVPAKFNRKLRVNILLQQTWFLAAQAFPGGG